jgi:hypothetical protein
MTIVFVCGSLEPGRDGVGDYTRRLAAEMVANGNRVSLLALIDRHISETVNAVDHEISMLRLPLTMADKSRYAIAKNWVDAISPDWVSVQFVIFAFHPRGLKMGLSKWLLLLCNQRKVHIMFHELWVGMDEESPWQHKVWGSVQKQLIRSLLKNLKPAIIHTQTCLYQTQLHKMGFTAGILPLFSNIPLYPSGDFGGNLEADTRVAAEFVFIIFGNIHHGAPIEGFVNEVAAYAAPHKRRFILKIIGRNGKEQVRWQQIWAAAGLTAILMGEQPAAVISAELKKATVGISTTPYALVDKSGAVAAMREHDLPVICVARKWTPAGIKDIKLIHETFDYKKGNLGHFLDSLLSLRMSKNDSATISLQLAKELMEI